ncbi:hypothetical protein MAR_018653 [Mya arenaria]|uniref:Uncharacterized protein n=1 Tax=Mya arenaria TaxID=6604 RepID=A0ABY7EHU6_MYAAR|nr:hypothetical protein MAR_018653 [Mya arenaria]
MRGRKDHTTLLWGDIELKRSPDNRKYLEITVIVEYCQREVQTLEMDPAETVTEKWHPSCLQHMETNERMSSSHLQGVNTSKTNRYSW